VEGGGFPNLPLDESSFHERGGVLEHQWSQLEKHVALAPLEDAGQCREHSSTLQQYQDREPKQDSRAGRSMRM
jgi:hypothetical protein